MNIYTLSVTIALAINITLGLVVFFHNPKRAANRLFALLVGSMAIWNGGTIILANVDSRTTALLGAQMALTGVFLFPVFFLHFTFVFPRKILSRRGPFHHPMFFYGLPVTILLFMFLTLQINEKYIHAPNNVFYIGLHNQSTSFYTAYFAMTGIFLLYLTYGIVNLVLSLKRTSIAKERLQIRYLIFGIIFMVLAGGIIDLLSFSFKLGYPSFFLAGLYTVILSVFFSIAIIKYRLLDIEIIIKRSLLLSALSAVVLTIYILLIKHLSDWLGMTTHKQSLFVESLFVLVLVIFLMPIKSYVERAIDRFVFPRRIRSQKRMLDFTKSLTHYINLNELCTHIVNFVKETFDLEEVAFFLWDEDEERCKLCCGTNMEKELTIRRDALKRWFSRQEGTIQVENITRRISADDGADILREAGIFVLVPIGIEDELWGYLALGKRKAGTIWEMADLQFLDTLANQASVAISRALIYEKEKEQERRMLQAEKLAALGTLSAGMAHEIRNPLHIISGSAETLMNGSLSKEEEREILKFIVDEAERLNRIVTHFLDFARPKEPELQKCHVVPLVDETLELISEKAKTANITIEKQYEEGLPSLYLDPEQLKQVLINIELNALEAMAKTQQGTLSVKVSLRENNHISISIRDTGVGIQKAIQSKIFDPFFTTKEQGTGLGLSISHRIIESMGGTISFVSSPGKGTTFFLDLPIRGGSSGKQTHSVSC